MKLAACVLLVPSFSAAAGVARVAPQGSPLAFPAAAASAPAALSAPSLGLAGPGLSAPAAAWTPVPAPTPADRELLAAARAGDAARVKAALASGADAAYADPGMFGWTPLLAAAAGGHAEAARLLVAAGADRNARDNLRATPLIYAARRGDVALLEAFGSPEGLDMLALDFGGRSAFDHAREEGHAAFESRLRENLAAVDQRAQPERYLVVNFLGFGGGGRVEPRELERDPRVAGVFHLRRSRADQKEIRRTIERWMEHDISKGGPRAQNLVIVGSSWGSAPAASLARWFEKTFGFKARLNVMVEAANIVGLPYRRIGPASETKNYHVEGRHWPTGGRNGKADANESLGDVDHDAGLFLGAQRAAADVQALLARGLTRTGEALREFIWTQRILPSAYAALPRSNPGAALKALRAFLTLGKTFDTDGDELPKSRGGFKLLHPFGSVLKVRYTSRPGHAFTGLLAGKNVPGLARLSLGAPQSKDSFIPGAALKLFVDGRSSVNAVFLGERTGVDGQQPETNFFAQAFTNVLPPARTRATRIAAFILGLFNRGNALRIPVDEFAGVNANGTAVAAPKAAYRLLLKPVAGRATPSGSARDVREELAGLAPGPLFEVWAAEGPGAPLVHVGDIEAETAPVASEYGDKGLFFRHRR